MQHRNLIEINTQVGKTMLIFRPALKNECRSEENYSWSAKPAITSNCILMSLSALRFLMTFFIVAVSVCCMLPRLSCLLTCHNDVIDAGQNNRLYAPSGTDMDRAFLRLSHMQNGMYYV